jgi:hypothetical protein
MDAEIKALLGKGLSGGYGSSNYEKGERVGFQIDINDYQGPDGRYRDEWAAHQNGGGQELIETPDGKKWTRVYAGGSLDEESLSKLGITREQVSEKIKFFLGKLGDKTRFDFEVTETEGDWSYSYKLDREEKGIPLVVGCERIEYKGSLVFTHEIINSPVD